MYMLSTIDTPQTTKRELRMYALTATITFLALSVFLVIRETFVFSFSENTSFFIAVVKIVRAVLMFLLPALPTYLLTNRRGRRFCVLLAVAVAILYELGGAAYLSCWVEPRIDHWCADIGSIVFVLNAITTTVGVLVAAVVYRCFSVSMWGGFFTGVVSILPSILFTILLYIVYILPSQMNT